MKTEPRVGIIGSGFMGTAHARAARLAGARVVGVAASTPEHSKEAAVRLDADRGFDSPEALLLDPEIDVVHVCVPNVLHLPFARLALAEGKHVICEKPLATDLEGARALVAALEEAGTIGTLPFVYRFHPMARVMRSRVVAGDLGSAHLAHGTYLQDWLSSSDDDDWRVDRAQGGASRAFADIGSHWFDLMEFVLHDRVARLSAKFARAFDARPTEDTALVQFETERGVVGSVVVSQVAPGRKNALVLEISGGNASARFDQERPDQLWVGRREAATVLWPDPAFVSDSVARHVLVPPGHPQGYLDCVDRFVSDTYAAIDGQAPDGLPTFIDGLRSASIVDAALRSAASNTWTEVEP
jgi:predicted dehydrogenase